MQVTAQSGPPTARSAKISNKSILKFQTKLLYSAS
jgi:hypothetical protein